MANGKIAANLIVWAVVACIILICGCGKEVSLEYDPSPDNLLIEYRTGGGLPTPWVDGIPVFRLYGDGRVIERPGADERKPMLEGKLTPGGVRALLESISATGFFNLGDKYENKEIMDGTTRRISVNLKDEKKEVLVYMKDVEEFDAAAEVLLASPLKDTREYVPDKGYLWVQKSSEAPTDQPAPPEIVAALPPAAELLQAAQTRQPVEISGETLVSMMRYESSQKYRGLVLKTESGQLTVFPLYQPVAR